MNLQGQTFQTMFNRYKHIKFIFIDEISMVGQPQFNKIAQRLQQLSSMLKKGNDAFGGLNVIVQGDLPQLQPIRDAPVYKMKDGDPYLWEQFNYCELTQNMRQAGDVEFQTLLNNLRFGRLTFEDKQILLNKKAHKRDLVGRFADDKTTYIFPTRKLVADHNEAVLKKISKEKKVEIHVFKATDTVSKNDLPAGQKLPPIETLIPTEVNDCGGIENEIQLCESARVILRRNINVEQGLVNGSFGTVRKIEWSCFRKNQMESQDLPEYVLVKFDNIQEPVKVTPLTVRFDAKNRKNIEIERRQLPLLVAHAVTAHKLQGCTVPTAVIYLGSKLFARGQAYVMLSRVRSLDDFLISELDLQKFNFKEHSNIVNTDAIEEIEKLRRLPKGDGPGRRRLL